MKIHECRDYGRFTLTLDNRAIVEKRINKMIPSMKHYGWLDSHPMLVRKVGDKYEILDGQGRFHAAKTLGIPVKFVVTDKEISIPEINGPQSPWSITDYVGSYAQQGNPEYHYLLDFSRRHKLPIAISAAILKGCVAAQGQHSDTIRSGKFKVSDTEFAEKVAVVVRELRSVHACGATTNCVLAVSRVMQVSEVNLARLCDAIRKHQALVRPNTTADGYVAMLEEIYNHCAKSNRLPIAFLAREAAQKRKATARWGNKKEVRAA